VLLGKDANRAKGLHLAGEQPGRAGQNGICGDDGEGSGRIAQRAFANDLGNVSIRSSDTREVTPVMPKIKAALRRRPARAGSPAGAG
jgi:hypothetical protein